MTDMDVIDDALNDVEQRICELGQSVLQVSASMQNLLRDQKSLRNQLRLLMLNWE